MFSQSQQTALMTGLIQESAPVFTVQPTLGTLAVGTTISVSGAVVTGYPVPVVTYSVTINNVPKTWPYTPVSADETMTARVFPLATNSQGATAGTTLSGTVPVPNVVPGSVGTLTITAITSTGATVNWSPPTTGGLPTFYKVNYRLTGAGGWTQAGTTTSLNFPVSGLSSSSSYDFQVVAHNAIGDGTPSATATISTAGAGAVYWPTTDLGHNVPSDSSYTTMRIFNDRMLATTFYQTDLTTPISNANKDVNGWPQVQFGFKVAEGGVNQLAFDPSVTGTWYMIYQSTVQRTITFKNPVSTITSHTFSGGVGKVQFTYTAGSSALAPIFDGAVSGIQCFDPTTSAGAIAGTIPPLFNAQYLRTVTPYAYCRFMDITQINGDFVDTTNGTYSPYLWKQSVEWADRRTPTNYQLNREYGLSAGIPLEHQVSLLASSGKHGWFNISELASDDCITQFATYLATNMPVGQWSAFELGNERWNTGGGFYNYHKAGVAAMLECQASMASTSGNKFLGYSVNALTFASNGTTATVVFSQAHGATTGNSVKVIGALGGYTGFAPASATLTVVDSVTVTYPCSQPSTGGTVTALTVLGSSGFISLNSAAPLMSTTNLISSAFDLSFFWHIRRVFQMAALVRAAFTAVGRTLADCKPLLALQAGQQYYYGNKRIGTYISQVFSGAAMSSRLTALSIGGYYGASQGSVNPGFGYTKSASDAGLVTEAAVNTQVQQVVSSAIGNYFYTAFMPWARDQGLEVWGYEIGIDLAPVPGESTTTRNVKDAYQADYATYGTSIENMARDWLRNLQALGFTKLGWYYCSAGTLSGYGCFNLGQSANEIDYTTALNSQSPKFRGIIDSQNPPTSRYATHAFPCTLSGWDCVGNEAVVTTGGVWPSLSGTNLPYGYASYQGPNANGQTWFVWSEITQTVTVTLVGDYGSGSAQTLVVQPLGGTAVNMSVGAAPITAGVLGTCSIQLVPGMNYVFISSASHSTTTFIHSVQFS